MKAIFSDMTTSFIVSTYIIYNKDMWKGCMLKRWEYHISDYASD